MRITAVMTLIESSESSVQCARSNDSAELLIRTSGETRLSDFMLWQASSSITYFSPVLWPDFSLWQLLAGIFFFQRQHARLQQVLRAPASPAQEKWAGLEQRNQVAEILHTWQSST